MRKPAGKLTAIESPALRPPPALALNCAVQVAPLVSAARVVAENVTAVGVVAGATTTGPGGLAVVVSELVKTDQLAAGYEAAGAFVTPAMVSEPLPAAARVQPAGRVMVIVAPELLPLVSVTVAAGLEQVPAYPPPRVTVGFDGTEKPAPKLMVIVSPPFSALVAV